MKKKFNKSNRLFLIERKIYRQRKRRRAWIKSRNFYNNRPKEKFNRKRKRVTKPLAPVFLKLPNNFSFISNPREVLGTFSRFRTYAQEGVHVILDFRHVERITPDVIPLLLAKVYKYSMLTRISGTRPLQPALNDILLESGFYKMVGLTHYKSERGLLETHKNKVVDREVAVAARRLTSEKTFGDQERKIQPLYRTLIECMANTRKHASEKETLREKWWLSVYFDPTTKRTCFSFCDMGVGIFKSTKLETLTKFALKIGLRRNRDILMQILEGKIASSTGLRYRGKGLPKIYSDYKNGSLKKLYIAANDCFADFDNGTFTELADQLNGTILYWEISPN